MSNHETTPLVPSTTDDTIVELDNLLYELEKRYPDAAELISVEVFADWLTAQLKSGNEPEACERCGGWGWIDADDLQGDCPECAS